MGVAERRLREKEARRIAILNAAEEVFFEHGIDNATMDAVAERAELSKGLLYVYYANKDDLAHAVAHRGLTVLIDTFEDVMKQHERGIDQISALGAAYVEFAAEYPDYFAIMVWSQTRRVPDEEPSEHALKCEHCGGRTMEITAQAVANGIADGSIRPGLDPMLTAISLYAQTHGVIVIAQSKSAKTELLVEPEQLISAALSLIRHGLECR